MNAVVSPVVSAPVVLSRRGLSRQERTGYHPQRLGGVLVYVLASRCAHPARTAR